MSPKCARSMGNSHSTKCNREKDMSLCFPMYHHDEGMQPWISSRALELLSSQTLEQWMAVCGPRSCFIHWHAAQNYHTPGLFIGELCFWPLREKTFSLLALLRWASCHLWFVSIQLFYPLQLPPELSLTLELRHVKFRIPGLWLFPVFLSQGSSVFKFS